MARSGSSETRAARAALAAAMLLAAALILWLQRGTTYSADELPWLQWAGIFPLSQVLHPYNGHLIALPLLTDRVLLEAFGTGAVSFRMIEVGAFLACAGLLYELARRRVGPWLALGPALLLLFVAGSWVLQPVLMMPAVFGIAFGLAALLALERDDPLGDVLCCATLALSLASFSIAIAFVAGAAVRILMRPAGWRALWVVALPLAAYLGWRYWASGLPETAAAGMDAGNVPLLPLYFSDSLAAVGTAIFGVPEVARHGQATALFVRGFDAETALLGALLGAIAVAVVVVAALAARRNRPLPVTLWAALAALLALWTTQGLALAEGRLPSEPRFILPGTVLLVLVAIELIGALPRGRVLVLGAGGMVLVALLAGVPQMRDARAFLTSYSRFAEPNLTAIELAGANADPALNPAVESEAIASGALYTSVGSYLDLVDRYGSPATPADQLPEQPEDVRAQLDRFMVLLLDLGPESPAAGSPSGRCRVLDAGPAAMTVKLPRGGGVLESDRGGDLLLRRFSTTSHVPAGKLEPGVPARLRIPVDASPMPWRVQRPAGAKLSLCPLG